MKSKKKKNLLKDTVKKAVKKIAGQIYSEVIYKHEKETAWEHTNFVIRFIYSSKDLHEELIEFLATSSQLEKSFIKYKDEYHVLIGGVIPEFMNLIRNTSNTNNRFFKETIENMYSLNEANLQELINLNIMDPGKFILFEDDIDFNFKLGDNKLKIVDHLQIDDIEIMYKKLNGLFLYRELTRFTKVSFTCSLDDEYVEDEITMGYMEVCNLLELIRTKCLIGFEEHQNAFKRAIKENFESIIGDISSYFIDNYMYEHEDTTEYVIVDEPLGKIVEEEFQITEDEDGNLKYNEKNFI